MLFGFLALSIKFSYFTSVKDLFRLSWLKSYFSYCLLHVLRKCVMLSLNKSENKTPGFLALPLCKEIS